MMVEATILVVDDEPKLVRLVTEVLAATGFATRSTASGEQAIEMIAVEQPDLVILDLVLAGKLDGYAVARRMREFSETPIIMLTAKARESDLLGGFEAGADDYLTKPFSARELLVRIRAVLKRARLAQASSTQVTIACGPLQVDLARRAVRVNDYDVHLTPIEYNLLYQLATHPNQVLLHEQLLTTVWGPEYRDDVDYLRAYVYHLRRKLEPEPNHPQLIRTQNGVGYMLHCPDGPTA